MASFLQEVDAGMDVSLNATNRSKQYPANISNGSFLIACFSTKDNNPSNVIISDDKLNTWTPIITEFEFGSGRGAAAYWARPNIASIGAKPTVLFNKNGAGCVLGASIYEVTDVHADNFDTTAVKDNNLSIGPAQVTLGATHYTNDIVMGVLGIENVAWVTATPLTNYVDSISNNSTGGSLQHKVIKRDTTSASAFTTGWTLSQNAHWAVISFVLKGYTTLPTITSTSSLTPRKNSTLTIGGVNFENIVGTVLLGGVEQAVLSWRDDEVEITVDEGDNKFGVPVDLEIITNSAINSNTYSDITELLPQVGWGYVNLSTPASNPVHRLTSVAVDLVSGDQVSYETLSGDVSVSTFAVPNVAGDVTEFSARAWTSGEGWGNVATESLTEIEPVVSSNSQTAQMIYLSTERRIVWRNNKNEVEAAPASISGYNNFSIDVSGTFGADCEVSMEGSSDGITYHTLVDVDDIPVVFTEAGVQVVVESATYMRPIVTDTDDSSLITVRMSATSI